MGEQHHPSNGNSWNENYVWQLVGLLFIGVAPEHDEQGRDRHDLVTAPPHATPSLLSDSLARHVGDVGYADDACFHSIKTGYLHHRPP
jgi:hypothetical protein